MDNNDLFDEQACLRLPDGTRWGLVTWHEDHAPAHWLSDPNRWTRLLLEHRAVRAETCGLSSLAAFVNVDTQDERHVHPHMLRHSFASRLRAAGGDLQLIQKALGHASINATTMYAHLATPARRQKIAELLGEG